MHLFAVNIMAKLSKKAKKQLINIVVLVVLIGITITVIFVSTDLNLHDIGAFISDCNPWYIVAAFGGLLGYIIFEAISLHIIARKLGHKSKFTSSVAYSTSDLYYSAITPSASGGQPASAFYMVRDNMSGGTAGFTVLFNIISYTAATIIVGLFALIAQPGMFPHIGHWFAKTLIIIGFVIQFLLLALLLLCLFRARVVQKIGDWGISLLAKIKIIKKPDKWRAKLDNVIVKYRSCRGVMKQHPMLFVCALFFNIAQRVSQTLIPCFVIMASPLFGQLDVSFLELFCMQAYVMIGYNSIPLPGGTGAYEYLYPNVFGIGFPDMTFILSAMMVSRAISYYACIVVCGLYTLIYHAIGIRKIGGAAADEQSEFDITAAVKQSLMEGGADDNEIIELIKHETPTKKKPARKRADGEDRSDGDATQAQDGNEENRRQDGEAPSAEDYQTNAKEKTDETDE